MTPETERRSPSQPFFSICIPQHNRTGLLIEALKVVEQQSFKDVEVCISEDCSTDGRQQEIVDYLDSSKLWHVYRPTKSNLRYDGNLRSAIGMACGRYAILFGNDDCLTTPDTLKNLHEVLTAHEGAGVLIGNFEDWATGQVTRRIRANCEFPGTSHSAIVNYRNLAFVSGLIVDVAAAQALETDRWDGSEMYQMFIFSRIVAQGRPLITIEDSIARKDMQKEGEFVDSYAKRARLNPCPIKERKMPFVQIGQVVADAVEPFQDAQNGRAERELIFKQLYLFTYPFWVFEYRRVQSWKFALGICLGMRPRNVVGKVDVGPWRRLRLRALWLAMCTTGLLAPISLFDLLRARLYAVSRAFGSQRLKAC
jgi:glycosyltransferase involved in cell wall biosynthesis